VWQWIAMRDSPNQGGLTMDGWVLAAMAIGVMIAIAVGVFTAGGE
jgi:hypothetical protein